MNKYLLDTNIYLDFYERYYRFSHFPSFWAIFGEIVNREVAISKIVLSELIKDEWFKNEWLEKNFHSDLTNHTDYAVGWGEVLDYIYQSPFYNDKAYESWADVNIADPWIIAIARQEIHIIVTEETRVVNLGQSPTKSAKIPDVADHFDIKCITMNDFFEALS